MDKRGAIRTVIGFTILFIFLGVVLVTIFCPDCLAPTVAKAAEGIGDNILSGLRKDKFEKPALEADAAVAETFNDIVELLRSEGNGPCLLRRKPFPDDFKDFKITLGQTPQGISVQVFNEDGQVMDGSRTITDRIPCVVGGGASRIFFDNYLDGSNCLEPGGTCQPNDVAAASIEFREENKIYVNGNKRDLKDKNLVFKTRSGSVCFIPTVRDGSSWSGPCHKRENGIDDDCLDEKLNDGVLVNIPMCGVELDGVFLCDNEQCLNKIPPKPWRKTITDIDSICDFTPSPEDSEPDGDEICSQIGSIRIIGDYDVRLYENKNYGGKKICFRDEGGYRLDDYDITCGFFGCNGWNQDTDSVQILPNGECTNPGVTEEDI